MRLAPWLALGLTGLTTTGQAVEFCGENYPRSTESIHCSGYDLGPMSLTTLLEFRNLKVVTITHGQLTDIGTLSQLPLDALELSNSTLDGPLTPVASMASLRSLKLNNVGDHTFAEVASLTGLERLTLGGSTAMTSATPLAPLTQLRMLTLLELPLQDLTPIHGAIHLERLYCASVPIQTVPSLAAMTSLMSVTLASAQLSSIAPVSQAPALTHLNLSVAGAVDLSALSTASSLVSLDIGSSEVTDISALYGLSQLNEVNVFNTPTLPSEQIDELRRTHPNIELTGP